MQKWITANSLIWIIYILLLGVLLPHTAWAFAKFEPTDNQIVAWGGAIAFEAAIAVFTHKLAKHIETTGKHKATWRRFSTRYLNAYGGGLLIAWIVSTLANLAHSVEFGQALKIFESYGIPTPVYAVAFGAILPTTSLLFARILSNVIEHDTAEVEVNPELQKTKEALRELGKKIQQLDAERMAANHRANIAEQQANESEVRFQAAGDIFVRLMAESKRDRILAAVERWPQLPGSAIAIITETSPSFVSEVRSEVSTNGDH